VVEAAVGAEACRRLVDGADGLVQGG